MIKLGVKATDIVTGFSGTVTGTAQYISGCSQALLVPRVKEDGSFVESQWFDEQRLTVDKSVAAIVIDNEKTPGPDKAAPKR